MPKTRAAKSKSGRPVKDRRKKPAPRGKPAGKRSAKNHTNAIKRTAKAAAGVRETIKKTLARKGRKPKKIKLSAAERKALRKALQELRDRVVDEISFLAGDNLNRSQRESSGDLSSYSIHMADHGTDNFDREFALNLVSSEQDVLYEIDDALRRLDEGSYGVCEACEQPIEGARLEALPFARMCVRCKAETERGRTRYRPFGPTLSQG